MIYHVVHCIAHMNSPQFSVMNTRFVDSPKFTHTDTRSSVNIITIPRFTKSRQSVVDPYDPACG